jgi:hypothetical protein
VTVFVIIESDVPSILDFTVGNVNNLGLETEKSDGKWFLVVRIAQDYEVIIQRRYRFLVEAAGIRFNVDMSVKNMDDERPYFDLPDSTPCQVSVSNSAII